MDVREQCCDGEEYVLVLVGLVERVQGGRWSRVNEELYRVGALDWVVADRSMVELGEISFAVDGFV